MIFPAKEMSNSMQEGSREKEIKLLRARSELIPLIITVAGNGPQGLLRAGLGWRGEERDSQCQKQSDTSPKTPAGIAAELLGGLRWIMTWDGELCPASAHQTQLDTPGCTPSHAVTCFWDKKRGIYVPQVQQAQQGADLCWLSAQTGALPGAENKIALLSESSEPLRAAATSLGLRWAVGIGVPFSRPHRHPTTNGTALPQARCVS